ncbi:hypothetical protein Q1695_013362 [Nippostrongylus brasiliensis]|nr:hypothetical protein Q1695_013362 [Nippostrongylus brasiliensis]
MTESVRATRRAIQSATQPPTQPQPESSWVRRSTRTAFSDLYGISIRRASHRLLCCGGRSPITVRRRPDSAARDHQTGSERCRFNRRSTLD